MLYSVEPGPNELLPDAPWAWAARSLPRTGSPEADLSNYFARTFGQAPTLAIRRQQAQASEGLAKGSDHIARLWASDRVLELMRADPTGNRAAAVALATQYRLVTPVSGAVVLETQQQYDESRLTPVSQATVPTVPEPHEWALLADRVRGIVVVGLAPSRPVRGGGVMHPLLLAALVTAATWDAWRWYLARVAAAPEEAAALALDGGVPRRARRGAHRTARAAASAAARRRRDPARGLRREPCLSCRRSFAPRWRFP